jgi:hypothetical protein
LTLRPTPGPMRVVDGGTLATVKIDIPQQLQIEDG